MSGNWKILVPAAAKNLFAVPSFEKDSDDTITLSGVNVDIVSTKQRRGARSAKWTINGTQDQIVHRGGGQQTTTFKTRLTSGQVYTFSCDVYVESSDVSGLRMAADTNPVFTNGTGEVNAGATITVGAWSRIRTVFTAASTADYYFGLATILGLGTVIYTDGWMLNEGDVDRDYFDGDSPGCYWLGEPHNSVSICPADNIHMGVWYDMEDTYGLTVMGQTGTGVAPVENQSLDFAQSDGAEYLKTVVKPRKFTLKHWLSGTSFQGMLAVRKSLTRGTLPGKQFWLKYTGGTKPVKIKALHESGLELTSPQGYTEIVGHSLTAHDPYFYETNDSGMVLTSQSSVATPYIARRKADGTWQAMGNLNGAVRCIYISKFSGRVYIGGDFTQDGSSASPLNHVAYWDEAASAWHKMGTGTTGVASAVNDICDDNEFVYVATDSNGVRAWLATSDSWFNQTTGLTDPHYTVAKNPLTGALAFGASNGCGSSDSALPTLAGGAVRSLRYDKAGTAYAVGAFTTGPKAAYCTNGGAWAALGSGINATGRIVHIAPDGTPYVGGDFTASGTVTMGGFAAWNGSALVPIGVGVADTSTGTPSVRTIATDQKGRQIIGGFFNKAGGRRLPYDGSSGYNARWAMWTGSVFLPMDAIVPESSGTTHAVAVAKDGTVYVGFANTGTGVYGGRTVVTNSGLATQLPRINFLDNRNAQGVGTIHRLENVTTGAILAFDNMLLSAQVDASLNMADPTNVLQSFMGGDSSNLILNGSSLAAFSLAPGDNTLILFTTNGGVTNACLSFAQRHIAVEGSET